MLYPVPCPALPRPDYSNLLHFICTCAYICNIFLYLWKVSMRRVSRVNYSGMWVLVKRRHPDLHKTDELSQFHVMIFFLRCVLYDMCVRCHGLTERLPGLTTCSQPKVQKPWALMSFIASVFFELFMSSSQNNKCQSSIGVKQHKQMRLTHKKTEEIKCMSA